MDFYYDILLNFQERYYMFYEWDSEDNIEYIKKIPLIHVDAKTYLNLITKHIKVSAQFLESIKNKTKLKDNSYLKYTAIFSDGKNSLAIEFDDNGNSLSKSSLILDDELNINEFLFNIAIKKLDYKVIKTEKVFLETRQEEKIKKILKLEIQGMYEKKEYSKLKYIYLEWFDKLSENIDKMYSEMIKKLEGALEEKEYYIYNIIKLSYNNV